MNCEPDHNPKQWKQKTFYRPNGRQDARKITYVTIRSEDESAVSNSLKMGTRHPACRYLAQTPRLSSREEMRALRLPAIAAWAASVNCGDAPGRQIAAARHGSPRRPRP